MRNRLIRSMSSLQLSNWDPPPLSPPPALPPPPPPSWNHRETRPYRASLSLSLVPARSLRPTAIGSTELVPVPKSTPGEYPSPLECIRGNSAWLWLAGSPTGLVLAPLGTRGDPVPYSAGPARVWPTLLESGVSILSDLLLISSRSTSIVVLLSVVVSVALVPLRVLRLSTSLSSCCPEQPLSTSSSPSLVNRTGSRSHFRHFARRFWNHT